MAWNDTELSINGVDKDGTDLITRTELFVILDQIKSDDKFFQIEPFEIMDIARSENSLIPGQVIGRNIYSEQGKDADVLQTYLPLNSNLIQYPIVGEIWFGLHYGNENTKRYYLSRVPNDILSVNYNEAPNHPSALNEVSANKVQRGDGSFLLNNDSSTETKQGQYFKDTSPRKEIGNEGDTIIQGRFGNSISLGSRQVEGIEDSPRITINNQRSIVDLESIDDIGLINVESDEILMTALTDEVNIRALKDININSSQGDVNLESQSNIVLKPRGSTIDFDIKNGGTILSSTKEGIPFPQLDMVGFLKQVTGIQQLFKALTIGVPKLSAVATLPSGVKDIVKGLEGAKNFIDATINLEFLSKVLMETKTIEEIKAVLPIPAGFGGIIDDISNITADQIKKLEELEKAATEKIKKAGELQSSLSGTPPNIAGVNKLLAAGDFDSFAGVGDLKSVIANGADPKALQNYIDNGGLTKFEDEVSDLGSVIGSTDQAKSYKNLFNTARS